MLEPIYEIADATSMLVVIVVLLYGATMELPLMSYMALDVELGAAAIYKYTVCIVVAADGGG